ncbi:ABC transporter transmembrane domain-containing protein, partial [Escherichia coli]|uniref:ABC transporter transmembrane domain-containing protein n=1 Tax=Escherichia coli TaxID=562 RepID=UPI003D819CF8
SRLTRMTVDVDSLARFLQNGLAGAATSLVTMFAIAATMFWLDPFLALTALSAVPVAAPARPFCRKRARESTSTVMRVRRESACFSCQGSPRRSIWPKLRKRTEC